MKLQAVPTNPGMEDWIAERAQRVDACLQQMLPVEQVEPAQLHAAMRWPRSRRQAGSCMHGLRCGFGLSCWDS